MVIVIILAIPTIPAPPQFCDHDLGAWQFSCTYYGSVISDHILAICDLPCCFLQNNNNNNTNGEPVGIFWCKSVHLSTSPSLKHHIPSQASTLPLLHLCPPPCTPEHLPKPCCAFPTISCMPSLIPVWQQPLQAMLCLCCAVLLQPPTYPCMPSHT